MPRLLWKVTRPTGDTSDANMYSDLVQGKGSSCGISQRHLTLLACLVAQSCPLRPHGL